MLDNIAIAPADAAASGTIDTPIPRVFTPEEERLKREEYLLKNPSARMAVVSAAITFAERNMPAHLRHNQPRLPERAED